MANAATNTQRVLALLWEWKYELKQQKANATSKFETTRRIQFIEDALNREHMVVERESGASQKAREAPQDTPTTGQEKGKAKFPAGKKHQGLLSRKDKPSPKRKEEHQVHRLH